MFTTKCPAVFVQCLARIGNTRVDDAVCVGKCKVLSHCIVGMLSYKPVVT